MPALRELFADPAFALSAVAAHPLDKRFRFTPAVRRLTLETTQYCAVACSFCKYNAPLPRNGESDPRLFLSRSALDRCLDYIAAADVPETVITGGGEPTTDLATVCYVLAHARSTTLRLYTAGQWGTDISQATEVLDTLTSALQVNARLVIRLSVDDFHAKRIGIDPILAIFAAFRRHASRYSRLSFAVRTVLHYDESVRDLASALGAALEPERSAYWILHVPDMPPISVTGMNLTPIGRVTLRTRHRYAIDALSFITTFCRAHFGAGWPLWIDGGLNIGVRPSGRVYWYGASPVDFGSVAQQPLADVLDRIAGDPLSCWLARDGLTEVLRNLTELEPQVAELAEALADPPSILPIALEDPRRLLACQLLALCNLCGTSAENWPIVLPGISPDTTIETIRTRYSEVRDETAHW